MESEIFILIIQRREGVLWVETACLLLLTEAVCGECSQCGGKGITARACIAFDGKTEFFALQQIV